MKRNRSYYNRSRSRSKSYYKPPKKKVKRTPSTTKRVLTSLGRTLGTLTPLGGRLGGQLGGGIASVFGQGDYYIPGKGVVKNSLRLNPGDTPPKFASVERKINVKHREYIKDIYSSVDFQITRFELNPGDGRTFPWLKDVARNFECYNILGMLFEFKSMSSNALASTNTALGTVIMGSQYNSASPNFSNKQDMENYEFSQSCKPAESMLHYIECQRGSTPLKELYIRQENIRKQDAVPQLYDFASFTIATQGMQANNVNIGELWVTYDIDLLKPKILNKGVELDLFKMNFSSAGVAQHFGTNRAVVKQVNMELIADDPMAINVSVVNQKLYSILILWRKSLTGTDTIRPQIRPGNLAANNTRINITNRLLGPWGQIHAPSGDFVEMTTSGTYWYTMQYYGVWRANANNMLINMESMQWGNETVNWEGTILISEMNPEYAFA